ncbi:MAG: hypothetical protein U0736_25290 [Gemmataceae bacterium]
MRRWHARWAVVAVTMAGLGFAPAPAGDTVKQLATELALPPLGIADVKKDRAVPVKVRPDDPMRYPDKEDPESPLRAAVRRAQLVLWATSPVIPPRELIPQVLPLRKEIKANPRVWLTRYDIPGGDGKTEVRMQQLVLLSSRELARQVVLLEEALDGLDRTTALRNKAGVRWQAHHDLLRGWLMARIAFVEELGLALGTLRKEPPTPDPAKHKAWQLRPAARLRDSASRKLVKRAAELFDKVARDHPDSPWARWRRSPAPPNWG